MAIFCESSDHVIMLISKDNDCLKQDATLSLRRPRDAPNIWVPWKLCVSTKAVNDCARISTLQSYHYSAVKVFSKYSNKCDHST